MSPLSRLCEIGHGTDSAWFYSEKGFIADGVNAVWYAAEKKPFEAICSLVSAIPGAGDKFAAMVQVGKITSKVFKNPKLIKGISHLMGNIGSLCISGVTAADSIDNLKKAYRGETYDGTILGNVLTLGLSVVSGILSGKGIFKDAKGLANANKAIPKIGSKGVRVGSKVGNGKVGSFINDLWNDNRGIAYFGNPMKTSYGKSSGNSSNLSEILQIMKNGEITPDGRNIITQLDDKTKVIFRMDVGENAHTIISKGYDTPVNHINIEIQRLGQNGKYKPKWDYHIILDDLGNIKDSFALGVWEK